jgi:hypothetical protein
MLSTGATANTDRFINQVGFDFALEDPSWLLFSMYGPGSWASRYVIINGVANSPKVKNVCVGNCNNTTDGTSVVWKTVLVVGEGLGGKDAFALDITTPQVVDGTIKSNASGPAPAPLLWHTEHLSSSKTTYDGYFGNTMSVPAFTYNKTTARDDYAAIFASGYSNANTGAEGVTLVPIHVYNGSPGAAVTIPRTATCTQDFAVLTDVATARDFGKGEQRRALAAYVGDTSGKLWRYAPSGGTVTQVAALGCDHPIHYAPTVVQLDRDVATNHPGDIYLIQATNSSYDPATENYQPSKILIRRDKAVAGVVTSDTSFGGGGQNPPGSIEVNTRGICTAEIVNGAPSTLNPGDCSNTNSPDTNLPDGTRPSSTPLAILKSDGSGFQFLVTWYNVGKTQQCDVGRSFITLHEYSTTTNALKQLQGFEVSHEPITGVTLVGGNFTFGAPGGPNFNLSQYLSQTLSEGLAGPKSADPFLTGGDRFRRLSWSELP